MAGWSVSQSIALELDVALSVAGGALPAAMLPDEMTAFVAQLPEEWRAQWPTFFGEARQLVSLLSTAAILAGTLIGGDYDAVTSAIRQMTSADALARVAAYTAPYGLAADSTLPPEEQLIDLVVRSSQFSLDSVGLHLTADTARREQTAQDVRQTLRVLRDGDLHTRFWHWLDRFYYASYEPWRRTRAEYMAYVAQHAATMLGAREQADAVPNLDWLPAPSMLRHMAELRAAVQTSDLHVVFWFEPFGMSDLWLLLPGVLLTAFAEPGGLFQNFQAFADDIASRSKALADPTRLVILRMIRNFSMINTEMAAFLELARPTVSIHAKILREAGLIRSQQDGRLVRHEIVPEEVRRLLRDLEHFLDLPPEE